MAEHHTDRILQILNILGFLALLWLLVRFALPWLSPLILAYLIAALLEKPVQLLLRLGWKRRAASAVMSLSVLALSIWGFAALIVRGISALNEFSQRIPELMQTVMSFIDTMQNRFNAYISASPEAVADYLNTALNALTQSLFELPSLASQSLLNLLSRTAQSSPGVLLFSVTAAIGSFLISAAFPELNAFLLAQLPAKLRRRLHELTDDIKSSFGGLLRSQLILMAMTFFELLIAFMLMHIDNALVWAVFTALVDALPVFGSGTVLLPWAGLCLIAGNSGRALALSLCWLLVNLIRSCTQAKLLGDQIGLDPLASLLAVYVGWRVWSVAGMLFFPLGLALLCRLNDKGIIKLWHSA